MRMTGTKNGCAMGGTRSMRRKSCTSVTSMTMPAMTSGRGRSGARRKTATRPAAGRGARQRLRVLETRPGVEHDDLLVLADPAVAPQPLRGCERRGALGAHQHPFGFAGGAHGGTDVVVADRHGRASRLAQRLQDDEV